jgi:DNA-binding transcriptional regulator LsrR (DeoR family)
MLRYDASRGGPVPRAYELVRRDFQKEYGANLNEQAIRAAIRAAFRDRLVAVQKLRIVCDYKLDPTGLAKKLKEAFPKLHAIVVDINSADASSDHVHEQLGHAAATFIDESYGMLADGDAIGLGSGRAVFNVITTLKELRGAQTVSSVSLFSLTGSVFPHNAQMPARELLDGDTHVVLCAEYFGNKTSINAIRHPIAANSESERNARFVQSWLAKFAEAKLRHAIVGVNPIGSRRKELSALCKCLQRLPL